MKTTNLPYRISIILLGLAVLFCFPKLSANAQADDPNPPGEVVKLIFIHHSCGENWLTDGHGNLGSTLGDNNYFVSDTNYGWGPDSIGDATDIPNWPDWFRGPESSRYMAALYSESGQNSSYTRNLSDPGGENQIVMFKSCFPNSNLDGGPNDPPTEGRDLNVGNAKYIYNDLLNYFSTRPDKLFIAITAPPVQDPTYASNARAFNTWLVNNWLQENNYPLNNVAVWDFYNVLTHPDNHHRFINGAVEYVNSHGNGTSHYPSEDDHPSPTGNRKATEEFLPMLNVFYHRWKSGAPAQPPVQSTIPAAEEPQPPVVQTQPPVVVAPPAIPTDLIDDFEAGAPAGSPGWQGFGDEGTQTSIACGPEGGTVHSGNTALHINFSVVANSWATCALIYDQTRDWRPASGLSFYMHANQPGLLFDVITYGGAPGAMETYMSAGETTQEMVDGWVYMEFPWDVLKGVDWEAHPGTPYDPTRVTGLALGIGAFPDKTNMGEIWIDDVRLVGAAAPNPVAPEQPPVEAPTEPTAPPPTEPGVVTTEPVTSSGNPPAEEKGGGGICPLAPTLGVMAGGFGLWAKRKKKLLTS